MKNLSKYLLSGAIAAHTVLAGACLANQPQLESEVSTITHSGTESELPYDFDTLLSVYENPKNLLPENNKQRVQVIIQGHSKKWLEMSTEELEQKLEELISCGMTEKKFGKEKQFSFQQISKASWDQLEDIRNENPGTPALPQTENLQATLVESAGNDQERGRAIWSLMLASTIAPQALDGEDFTLQGLFGELKSGLSKLQEISAQLADPKKTREGLQAWEKAKQNLKGNVTVSWASKPLKHHMQKIQTEADEAEALDEKQALPNVNTAAVSDAEQMQNNDTGEVTDDFQAK